MKLFFNDGNQYIGGDGAPDLRFESVLTGAQKPLDTEVLLDPFEEQLHLPSALVQRGNGQRWQRRVVRQKHQGLTRLRVFKTDTRMRS